MEKEISSKQEPKKKKAGESTSTPDNIEFKVKRIYKGQRWLLYARKETKW